MIEDKKTLRRTFNLLAAVLILYNFLFNEAVYLVDNAVFAFMENLYPDMSYESIYSFIYYSGHSLIIGASVSVLAAYICCRQLPSFKRERKADFKTILKFFVIMQGIQMLCIYAFEPIEYLISILGYNTDAATEAASAPSIYFSSLVYSVVVAPLSEELFCRGLLMRKMERFGKLFAVIMSALLFGLIHGNIVQFPVTFAMGILFGIMAQRYSLGAAIVLHMLNNLFVELMGNLIYLSDLIWAADMLFMFACFAVTIFMFAKNYPSFKEYWHEKKPDRELVKSFFTAPLMFVVIAYFIVMTILSVSPM